MSYLIKSSTKEKVILERPAVSGLFFILAGCFFVAIGTALFIFLDKEPPFIYFMIVAPAMGAMAIFAGINVPGQTKKTIPELVIFNNEEGYVKIQHAADSSLAAYIPYEEIDKFEIRVTAVQNRTGSDNSLASTNTVYTYKVILRKKNTGEWELFIADSQAKAEEWLSGLTGNIQLNQLSRKIPEPVISDKVQKETRGNKEIITWRNNPGLQPVFIVVFALLFLFILYAILSMSFKENVPFFVYIVAGFILVVFIYVIAKQILKTIKNYLRIFSFSIDPHNFEYTETDKAGNIKTSKLILLKDIHSVSFNFQPSETTGQVTPFIVRTIRDKSEEEKETGNALAAIKKVFSANNIYLDLASLNAVEKLELERWIQLRLKPYESFSSINAKVIEI